MGMNSMINKNEKKIISFNPIIEKFQNDFFWSIPILLKFSEKYDWRYLSLCNDVIWTYEIIEAFEDKWNWDFLSENESLCWDKALIKKYTNKWNWEKLSKNNGIKWSQEIIETFDDKWNWNILSKNENICWDENLISKFSNKWNFYFLSHNPSIKWSFKMIEIYSDRNIWDGIKKNYNITWNIENIIKFKEKIDFWYLDKLRLNSILEFLITFKDDTSIKYEWVYSNPNFILFFNKYLLTVSGKPYKDCFNFRKSDFSEHFDFDNFIKNNLQNESFEFSKWKFFDYTDEDKSKYNNDTIRFRVRSELKEEYQFKIKNSINFIKTYLKKDYTTLIMRLNKNQNRFLIDNCIDEIDISRLCGCEELDWSFDFIEKYEDEINWYYLINNKGVRWDEAKIRRFASHFSWKGGFSGRTGHYHYGTCHVANCSNILFPVDVLEKYTLNWKLYEDCCENADEEGDWTAFSKYGKINIDILTTFSEKLNWLEILKREQKWTMEEVKFLVKHSWSDESIDILIKNEYIFRFMITSYFRGL